MDLGPYLNPTPYTLMAETPLVRVFDLYRTMGLRHIPILDEEHCLVGLVTRKDLTLHRVEELNKLQRQRSMATRRVTVAGAATSAAAAAAAAAETARRARAADVALVEAAEDAEDDDEGGLGWAGDYYDDIDEGGGLEARPQLRRRQVRE